MQDHKRFELTKLPQIFSSAMQRYKIFCCASAEKTLNIQLEAVVLSLNLLLPGMGKSLNATLVPLPKRKIKGV